MKTKIAIVLLGGLLGNGGVGQETGLARGYENDFEKVEVGAAPEADDFMVLGGKFTVEEGEGGRYLEVKGTPVDTYAVVFGPDFQPRTGTSQSVSARIQGTATGRRYPAFGVGLCGAGGYRLQLTPSKRALELYDGEELVASREFVWKPGRWALFRLRLSRDAGKWIVEGRVWNSGEKEPVDWTVRHPPKEEPIPGKASIWGIPYSGKSIRFDDLSYRLSP